MARQQEPLEEERTWAGGAEPTREPRSQDSAGAGRGAGLGLTTILGAILIAVPLIWAVFYLVQAGTSGLGNGFVLMVGIVLLACIGAGVLLLRGLFTTQG
jgi:hypothetical protein